MTAVAAGSPTAPTRSASKYQSAIASLNASLDQANKDAAAAAKKAKAAQKAAKTAKQQPPPPGG